jgi:endoglucanase
MALSHRTSPHRPRRRPRLLAGLIGIAALALGSVVVPAALSAGSASAATPACQVDYSVTNAWPGGFQGAVVITNNGAAVNAWTLSYSYAGNQMVTSGWNGNWSETGAVVTVTNASWNGTLATGGQVTLGFIANVTGTNTNPAMFMVNGVVCNGATTPPPTTTNPPPPTTTPPPTSTPPPASGAAPQLHVVGNKLVDGTGKTVVLHGVNRSGGEFACVQGNGFWDGPMDQASVTAIKSWGVTAVRVPVNSACWNAESYVTAADAGAAYQSAVKTYVSLLNNSGIVAILDLHWTDGLYTGNSSGCASAQATCQKPMPDAAQSVPFWSSVASTFKGNNSVIFDLFNEPFPSRATGSETTGWQCWLSGGTCAGIGYQVAGMQTLVNTIRATGASNVLMLGGIEFSNDLTQWLQFKPTDPDNNLVASWHSYNFNTCSTQACWTSQIAPVAASVPVMAGEIGENDCAGGYINSLMSFLDSQGISYLGWTWNAWDCSQGPSLITDYTGAATPFGAAFKAHILSLPH